ncbi:MAG: hypothetical protein ACXACP_10465 [Candidatus Hodarchaeales archaeon]|jgi:hypothetical protein
MEQELDGLVQAFLGFRKFKYHGDIKLRGRNEKNVSFSYLVHGSTDPHVNLGGNIGVIVKDWSRSCGYNCILEAERLQSNSPGVSRVMVVANQFSSTARELAEKLGVLTLTKGELVSIQNMYRQQYSAAFDP